MLAPQALETLPQSSTVCATGLFPIPPFRTPRGAVLSEPEDGPADISVVVGWLSQRGMRRPLPRPLQSWSFPRKEVIQPHLPVRLPCYDFTPVTGPTFDGSLPKG